MWRKDPFVAIDLDTPLDSESILTPNVVALPTGGYRMYYTGRGPARNQPETIGYILSARSDDGETWQKEPGIRIDVHPPHAAIRTLCPDVIPLPDGSYRMYYEARSAAQPTKVLSARSSDGLEWELEPGIRFGDDSFSYGSPRCLYIADEALGLQWQFRLYFHRFTLSTAAQPEHIIISAISHDGLHFEAEEGIRIAQETARENYGVYAPEVIRLGNGKYRMYYPAWSKEISGGVFTATSSDGLSWIKEPDPCVDLGDQFDSHMLSEPCMIELSDGRSRMFYEAKDANGDSRILSATSV